MRFLDYLRMRTGVLIDVDGAYGPQCTDLVNDYLRWVWGAGPLAGNAVDFQRAHLPGWTWVPNGPTNAPPAGAIVVWGGPNLAIGTSAYGHTAVALLADDANLLSLDQNWPPGHAPAQTRHTYGAILGWWASWQRALDRR